jgi:DNA-binding CsgD family transcriptional regulator
LSIDEGVLAVVESLYDAAVDDSCWPHALTSLIELTGSEAATFWVLNGSDRPSLPVFTYVNLDPAFVHDYLHQAAHMDPTVQHLVAHPDQPIVHDGLVITEREKDRHAYYDWHARYSDLRFRLVGQVCPAPGVQAGVALHRGRRTGRYEQDDIDRFAFLHHHLEQTVRIACRLGSIGALERCSAEQLDRHPSAVILLDKRRQVVFANRRAEALRANGDGISFCGNAIALLHRGHDAVLQEFITELLPGGGSAANGKARAMRASRPSGKRPYGILVTAMAAQYSALSVMRPAVCVVVSDPDAEGIVPSDCLQAVFGLTRAEAHLAARLADGEDLKTAADHLGITYGTARTRLAEIFQKTETRRQGELIRLLLTTIPTA